MVLLKCFVAGHKAVRTSEFEEIAVCVFDGLSPGLKSLATRRFTAPEFGRNTSEAHSDRERQRPGAARRSRMTAGIDGGAGNGLKFITGGTEYGSWIASGANGVLKWRQVLSEQLRRSGGRDDSMTSAINTA